MCERMGNYDIIADAGALKNTMAKCPSTNAKSTESGGTATTALWPGKIHKRRNNNRNEVYATGRLNQAVDARLAKSTKTWHQAGRGIFRHREVNRE